MEFHTKTKLDKYAWIPAVIIGAMMVYAIIAEFTRR